MKNRNGIKGLVTFQPKLSALVLLPAAILLVLTLASTAAAKQAQAIPNACSYLTAELASGVLGQKVLPISGNEHYPTFYSQCRYKGTQRGGFKVSFVFKFMLKDMFDVKTLLPQQLDFNAAFAGGGNPHTEKLTSLGELSYVFEGKKDSYVLMLTGIEGPLNGAGQETMIVAHYQLDNKNMSHEQRRDWMVGQARKHYEEWIQGQ